jgi:hypothetical protein
MVWYIGGGIKEQAGINALEVELARASDRAAAILAGSLVEARLTDFLGSHVQDDGKIWKERTYSSAPLGSFAVKFDLAFLFHLITKLAHSDLIVMKDIRNRFAHDLDVQNFQAQSIKDKCGNLQLADIYVKNDEALSMYRVANDGVPDAITGRNFTFHIGGSGAREELADPRKRYIWTTKIFNIAFGLRDPTAEPALAKKRIGRENERS